MFDVEDGDHNDFEQLFHGVAAKDIPENMKCLWDQQTQVLLTTLKSGYRCHPKYVSAISGRQTDRQKKNYVTVCTYIHVRVYIDKKTNVHKCNCTKPGTTITIYFVYRIVQLCIDLYCKNPHVLDSLRQFICLSSNRTIRYL